jgi:hypothetical protein
MEEKKTDLKVTLSTLAEKINTFLGKEKEVEPVKLAAEAVKEDGTVVYTDADEFAVGASVFVKEGEEILPAPDGEHKLEDGTVVVVSEGAVESIQEAEVEEEEMSDEDAPVTRSEFAELKKDFGEILSILQEGLSEVSKESKLSTEKAEALEAELSAEKAKSAELEAELEATPAVKSVKKETVKKEPVTLSAEEIANMPTKDYIRLTREYPELLPKSK